MLSYTKNTVGTPVTHGVALDDVEEVLLEQSDEDVGLLDIVPITLVLVIVAEGTPPQVDRVGYAVESRIYCKSCTLEGPLRLFSSPSTDTTHR